MSNVTVPSLSQLVYHKSTDTVTGGNTIFSFRAGGGVGTADRTPILTEQDLSGISDMGNSILGGDNVFPDGPDIITVTATLTEDISTGDMRITKQAGDPDGPGYKEEVMEYSKGGNPMEEGGQTIERYEEATLFPDMDGKMKDIEDGIEPDSI